MTLSTNCYLLTLTCQILFIVADITFNEMVQWSRLRLNNISMVVIFCVQDVVIILATMVLGYSMFKTHVFEAGFVRVLLRRFKFAIIFTLLYLILTITYQAVTLATRWNRLMEYIWPSGYSILFVTHRIIAVLYYYYYKRAALRLSDARYYDEEWVKHSFVH
ncbi:transmembrane protein 138 [Nesidiocoris tenuis]|uniref:Transmembrane protein 138 n=1 Tax=Nesidiocoris tenuis TaxID=355587 RepID=A0ABN7AAF3_9HEMI|nr:transmembrane protein 138 [Nesidiocoris tenuis]